MNLEEFAEEEIVEEKPKKLSEPEFLEWVAKELEPFVIFPDIDNTAARLREIAYRIRSLEK